jgi:hypothetical protein
MTLHRYIGSCTAAMHYGSISFSGHLKLQYRKVVTGIFSILQHVLTLKVLSSRFFVYFLEALRPILQAQIYETYDSLPRHVVTGISSVLQHISTLKCSS